MQTITICNWNQYQPRKDRSRHLWFRMENDVEFNRKLFELDNEQKWFWVCLLAYASRCQNGEIAYDKKYLSAIYKISIEKMDDTLKKLVISNAIEISDGTGNQAGKFQPGVVTGWLPPQEVINRGGIATIQYNTEQTTQHNTTHTTQKNPEIQKAVVVVINSIEELKAGIGHEKIREWRELYPDASFREREMIKAFGYYNEHQDKRPSQISNWRQAIGSWYERSWKSHKPAPQRIVYPDSDAVIAEMIAGKGESRMTPEELKELTKKLSLVKSTGPV